MSQVLSTILIYFLNGETDRFKAKAPIHQFNAQMTIAAKVGSWRSQEVEIQSRFPLWVAGTQLIKPSSAAWKLERGEEPVLEFRYSKDTGIWTTRTNALLLSSIHEEYFLNIILFPYISIHRMINLGKELNHSFSHIICKIRKIRALTS